MIELIKKALFNRRSRLTQEEYAQRQQDISDTYARLFSTDDGKYVLDHLVQTQLAVPIAQSGDNLIDIGEKQGRANLVNEIIQRIERSTNGVQEA